MGNSTLDPTMAGEGRKIARGSWGESERLLRSEKKTLGGGGGEGVTYFFGGDGGERLEDDFIVLEWMVPF